MNKTLLIATVILSFLTTSLARANTVFFTNIDRFSGNEALIDFGGTGIPPSAEINTIDNVDFNLLQAGTNIDTGFGPTMASGTYNREFPPIGGSPFLNTINFNALTSDLEILFESPVTRVGAEIRSGQILNDVDDLTFELYLGSSLIHEETLAIRGQSDFFFYGLDSSLLFDRWIIRQQPDNRFGMDNLRFEVDEPALIYLLFLGLISFIKVGKRQSA